MGINLKNSEVPIRENRLGSIVAYSGSIKEFGKQGGCSGCNEKKRCFSQSSACNNGCAIGQLFSIYDAAIVEHSPAGCASIAMASYLNDLLVTALGKKPRQNSGFTCSDMGESDTVFGAIDNLKDVIIETYNRYQPKAIFVASSCVSGVIGEDLESIVEDLKDIIPVPIAPVHCEGFKTQIWASGFDAAFHAILKYIVKPAEKKTNKVNVLNFAGGTSWNSRADVLRLFKVMDVEPTFILNSATVEELQHLSEARATISTCGALSTYFGNGLEQEFGVPFVRSLQPHGVIGYEDWALKLAKILDKEKEVTEFLAEEKKIYQPQIDEFAKKLKGKRAMIAMGPSYSHNYARILEEFGMQVEHVTSWHMDDKYDDGSMPDALKYIIENSKQDYKFSVNELQNYEFVNILKRVNPDIFVTRHPAGMIVWSMKLGIPAYNVRDEYTAFGYKGTLRFVKALYYTITNRSFTDSISKHVKMPYNEWWYQQPAETFFVDN
jgi:nitrogenase molybdenum-iron protein alpha chain